MQVHEMQAKLAKEAEVDDVFPEDIPAKLAPIKGIKYQIDLVPGSALPNKRAFKMNPEEAQETAFNALKDSLTQAPILTFPDFELSPFEVVYGFNRITPLDISNTTS